MGNVHGSGSDDLHLSGPYGVGTWTTDVGSVLTTTGFLPPTKTYEDFDDRKFRGLLST